MKYKQKIIKTVKLLLTLLILATVVVAIRYYLIESFCVSTTAMENTIMKGDLIIVDKLQNRPVRNEVMLFTSPLRKDTVYSPVFLSRCIGLPGDTIQVSSDGYTINGRFYPLSPNTICHYKLDHSVSEVFFQKLKQLKIPIRNLQNKPNYLLLSLTPFEEYTLREELPETVNQVFTKQTTNGYSLVVPKKNVSYKLNRDNLIACKEAILREAGEPVTFWNDKIYLHGKEESYFTFKQDYYWVLADNMNEGIDSRHLGFIPSANIIGTAWYCWFSPQTNRFFKRVK